ncbi:hypothetical protein ACEWY4_011056 [Coilia grayii]|uniref:Uncharacterized protein n=1 Tax=Coilia grayii TaxID=363190 RepID=A0ABD1K3R2_9TELE
MIRLRYLSVLISQRLTLAAQDIFKDVEETIVELHEETKFVKLENTKLKLKLRESGIHFCDESREAVAPVMCPTAIHNCEDPRSGVVTEDSPTAAPVKEELDALAENGSGPEDKEQMAMSPESVAMHIKIETNFTDCTSPEKHRDHIPHTDSSGTQIDARVAANPDDALSWLALEPREPEVFPCVARTWSVRESSGTEAEPQGSVATQVTERSCSQSGDCPSDDNNNDDGYDDFDDVEDGEHRGNDHNLNPESENVAEMSFKPQMSKERPYTRRKAARCGKEKHIVEDVNVEGNTLGKGTISKNATQLVKRPRGRPRKNHSTSISMSALNDLTTETRGSHGSLRSENESTVITGKLRGRTRKGPLTNTKKVVQIDGRNAPIGRPIIRLTRLCISKTTPAEVNVKNGKNTKVQRSILTRVKPNEANPDEMNLKNGQNTSVQASSLTLRTGRPRGRPRKNPQSITDEPSEVGHVNSVPEEPPLKSCQMELEHMNSISKEPPVTLGEVALEHNNSMQLEEPHFTPDEVVLKHKSRASEESPVTPCEASLEQDVGVLEEPPFTSGEVALEHDSSFSEEPPYSPGEMEFEDETSVSEQPNRTGEIHLEQKNNVDSEEPHFTPNEVVLKHNSASEELPFTPCGASSEHDTQHSFSEEPPYSHGGMEFEDETSISEEPTFSTGDVHLEWKNNVEPEEPPISEGCKDLSRPSRKSERLRRQSENTIQPVDRDQQDSASSDEASSGSERDSSALKRPKRRQVKRCRTPFSDFEIEREQEDDSSGEESNCKDSPINTRPRKHRRISRSKPEDAALETGVSVLTLSMRRVKRQYCVYCSKPSSKLARHLELRHYDQEDVVKALSHPRRSNERKRLLARIRNSGNRAHNNRVLKEGKGVLIPCRAFKSNPKDTVYCPGCQGMFSKLNMSKHVKTCQLGQEELCAGVEYQSSLREAKQSPKNFLEVLTGMYEDDVAEAVRGDKLVLKLGQHLFDKKHTCEYIWQKLRELGRLLLNGRKITPLKNMEDYIRLSNWDHLAAAVKDVTGYCESTRTFAISRYAVSLRLSFHSIAEVIKHDANTTGDKETVQNAERFLDCLMIKWHQEFSAPGKSSSNSSSSVVAEEPQEGSDGKNRASSPRDDIERDGGVGHDKDANSDLEKDDDHDHGGNVGGIEDDSQCSDRDGQDKVAPPHLLENKTPQKGSGGKNCASSPKDDDGIERDGGVGLDKDHNRDLEEDDNDHGHGGNVGGTEDDSSQCSNTDGRENVVPLPVLESKTDNATNVSLNGLCDSTQNDTVAKPFLQSELPPQRVATADVTSSPVKGLQESSSITAPNKSDVLLSSLVNSEEISIVPKGRKTTYCLFCKKQVTKLPRHLETHHYEQERVAKALSYPKGSKERKMCLKLLQRKGNRVHNIRVLKEGKGDIIPCRQPGLGKPGDFMHCPYCDGLFIKRGMLRHLKDCSFLKEEDRPMLQTGKKFNMHKLYGLLEPQPDNVSKDLWRILEKMHQDEITLAARGDKYALQLGEQLLDKGQGDAAVREDYIRQRIRELGRLLVTCQRITPMYSLMDLMPPKNWDHLIAVLNEVAGRDDETGCFCNPTILTQLYRSLQKIGRFVESDAVSQQDEELTENARSFNKDFVKKWRKLFPTPYSTRKSATTSSQQRHKIGVKLLPFTEDIKNLHTYLKDHVGECLSALCASPNQTVWANLAKTVLAQLIMFNRRKAREVAQLTLKEFNTKEAYGMPDDDAEDLTPFERELCKYTCRIEISRATGDNVQLLIPPSLATIMETMLHKRLLCSIRYDNIFMFAQPRSLTYYSGVESLESFAKDCGAKHVKKLVSDGLREHVAVISQLLYLKDMHQVTEFMGLSLATHLSNDCVQQETLELARLGKFLTAMEKGQSRPPEQNVQEIVVTPDGKCSEHK